MSQLQMETCIPQISTDCVLQSGGKLWRATDFMHTSISQVHGQTKPNQSNPEFLISKCRSPMLKYAWCFA